MRLESAGPRLGPALRRPLPLAALGYVGGEIAAAQAGAALDVTGGAVARAIALVVAVAAVAALCTLVARARRGRRPLRPRALAIFLAVAFAAWGASRVAALPEPVDLALARDDADAEADAPLVAVDGVVCQALLDLPRALRDARGRGGRMRSRILLDDVRVRFGDARVGLGGAAFPLAGRASVEVPEPDRLIPRGTRVRLLGRARPPRPPRNPGDDDDRRRWRLDGIALAVAVESSAAIKAQHAPAAADLWLRGLGAFDRARGRVVDRLAAALPAREAGLAAALLLGVRDGLDPDFLARVAGAGTIHVLAISGAHVALLLIAVRGLLGLVLRPGPADVLALLAAAGYAALAGAEAPVLRAALGSGLALTGTLIGRPPRPLDALALAAIALLAIAPGDLFRPGFQLSFVACFALLTRTPLVPDARSAPAGRVGVRLLDALLLSVRASVFTAPLVVHHFGYVGPLGPILTLLVTPPFLLAFLLTAALALVTAALPAGPAALAGAALGPPAALALRLLQDAFEETAALPLAQLALPRIGAVAAGAFLLAVVVARDRTRGACALALLGAVLEIGRSRPPAEPELWLLDVGHGQAALLRLPDGTQALFDCGSRGDGVAARTVERALDALGDSRVDLLVLTHGDADHVNGAAALLRGGRVRRLVHGPSFDGAAAGAALRAAQERGVPVERVARGDLLLDLAAAAAPDGVAVSVLAPEPGAFDLPENDLSLVVRVAIGRTVLLLPGDVESRGIERLMRLEPGLRADVVVLPHHGHADPWLPPLLHRLDARLWLASRGREGGDELAPRLAERAGAAYLATPRLGAIRVRFRTRDGPQAEGFRAGGPAPRLRPE